MTFVFRSLPMFNANEKSSSKHIRIERANKAIYHIIISICVDITRRKLLTNTFNQLDESNQQIVICTHSSV